MVFLLCCVWCVKSKAFSGVAVHAFFPSPPSNFDKTTYHTWWFKDKFFLYFCLLGFFPWRVCVALHLSVVPVAISALQQLLPPSPLFLLTSALHLPHILLPWHSMGMSPFGFSFFFFSRIPPSKTNPKPRV